MGGDMAQATVDPRSARMSASAQLQEDLERRIQQIEATDRTEMPRVGGRVWAEAGWWLAGSVVVAVLTLLVWG